MFADSLLVRGNYILYVIACRGRNFLGNQSIHSQSLDVCLAEAVEAGRNVGSVGIDEVAVVQVAGGVGGWVGTIGRVGKTERQRYTRHSIQ